MFSLEGKVALITGASRGMGKATALGFAKMGADVIVVSRKLPDLEVVAKEIRGLGRRSAAIAAHLGKLEDIDTLIQTVKANFEKIDILVNNAGTSPTWAPALDVDERSWDSLMNLNLKGLFFLSQAVAKMMKENGGGIIINVSSVDAIKPEPNLGVYSISKAAIIMATKVMAVEWAKYNIRVNAIVPGQVHTKLGDSRYAIEPELEAQFIQRTPLGRIAQPDEIIGTMIYLASDSSNFMTGQSVIVDGGFLLT